MKYRNEVTSVSESTMEMLGLARGVFLYLKAVRIAPLVRRFDRMLPKGGELGEKGYMRLPDLRASDLHDLSSILVGGRPALDKSAARCLNRVFSCLNTALTSYLGPGVRVDTFSVSIASSGSSASVSSNWHTDNVGHRLKCFICLKGDGSIPTEYVPGTHMRDYFPSFFENLRFGGLRRRGNRPNQISIRHQTGTVYLFDTNGLHRGSYERGESERIVVEIEFADRRKSSALTGRAPIGPGRANFGNWFVMSKEFYEEFVFKDLLDKTLMVETEDGMISYGS